MSIAATDQLSSVDYPAWRAQGACAGKPIEWFFPNRGESNADAVAVCAGCPVLVDCRQWGIEHEKNGVWGGLSERERQRVRRRLGIICHVPEETPPMTTGRNSAPSSCTGRDGTRPRSAPSSASTYAPSTGGSTKRCRPYPPPTGARHGDGPPTTNATPDNAMNNA